MVESEQRTKFLLGEVPCNISTSRRLCVYSPVLDARGAEDESYCSGCSCSPELQKITRGMSGVTGLNLMVEGKGSRQVLAAVQGAQKPPSSCCWAPQGGWDEEDLSVPCIL